MTTRPFRWRAALATGLVAAATVWLAGRVYRMFHQDPSGVTEARVDGDSLCGPRALYNSAILLGLPIEVLEVARGLELGPRGVSVRQLKERAEGLGLTADARITTWEELRGFNGVAILFVSGNHFVCVDPRDRPPSGDDAVRVFDETPQPEWWDRSRVETVWRGHTLFLSRGNPVADAPALSFDRVLRILDQGEDSSLDRQVVYHVTNTGNRVVRVNGVKTNCGCAAAEASRPEFAPGESGTVTLKMSLRDRNGPFETSAAVLTDDPVCPTYLLILRGVAVDRSPVTVAHLDIGEVRPGSPTAVSFRVRRRGPEPLDIGAWAAEFKDQFGRTIEPNVLGFEARWRPWSLEKQSASEPPLSVPDGRPGDVLVTLTLRPSDKTPTGPITGSIRLTPGGVWAGHTLTVTLAGRVLESVTATPPALVLIVPATGAMLTRSIELTSGQPVEAVGVEVGDLPVTARLSAGGTGVVVSCDPARVRAQFVQGEIRCRLRTGGSVTIPCQIIRSDGSAAIPLP